MIYNHFDLQQHILPIIDEWEFDVTFPITPTRILDAGHNDPAVACDWVWEYASARILFRRGVPPHFIYWNRGIGIQYDVDLKDWLAQFRMYMLHKGYPKKQESLVLENYHILLNCYL